MPWRDGFAPERPIPARGSLLPGFSPEVGSVRNPLPGHSKRYGLCGATSETANAQALPPLTPQQPSARGPATRPGSAGTPPVAAPHPRRIVARNLVHSPRPVPRQLNLQLRHHRNPPRPHQRRRRCRAAHLKTVSHPVPGSPEEAPGSSASSSPTAPFGSPSRSRPASASEERAQRTRFGAAGGASSPQMPRLRGLCAFGRCGAERRLPSMPMGGVVF
jgi:hypothetical protein